jgi:hypothetical protein
MIEEKIDNFFSLEEGSEELEKLLVEDTNFHKIYAIKINGLTFRRHIAKVEEETGLPKYLSHQRIKINGTSPVKGAFWKVQDGK